MTGPSFHLDVHSRPLPLRGYLVSFQHPGSPRGFPGGGWVVSRSGALPGAWALRFWNPSGQAGEMLTSSDFGRGWRWAVGEEVNPRSGQKTANRLGRGRAAGSGSASSPRTGRASGSTGVWDPGHQSKGGMDGPPEVALSLRPGPCRSRAGWDLRRQRCGSQSGAVGSQSGAERQRQKRKEPAFRRRSSPSSRSSPSPPAPAPGLAPLLSCSSPLRFPELSSPGAGRGEGCSPG